MLKPVSGQFNVTLLEEEALRIWRTKRVNKKLSMLRKDKLKFIIYESPDVTRGKPDLQDALRDIHQDFWQRYKTMQGLYVKKLAGWNTHGMPVELGAETLLGLTSMGEVESYGMAAVNDYCQQLAIDYVQSRQSLSERLSGWDRTDICLYSHEVRSIEAVWSFIKRAWDGGLIYQEEGVVPFCPHCGTVLAEHEIVYRIGQAESLAGYVRLPLLDDPGTSLLVWTENFWSLPGNTAVAVNPDADYVIVEHNLPESEAGGEGGTEKLIVTKDRLEQIFRGEAVRAYESFKGSKLEDLKYRPLFQFLLVDKPTYRVILDDFFDIGRGSGIEQIAPAFDAHHFHLATQNDLPILMPIGEDGIFASQVRPWRGLFFIDAEAYIRQDLNERGLLYRLERYDQGAGTAVCGGCGSPLLPYIRNPWYMRTQNQGGKWLLGRTRYWGAPLPIWQCSQCGYQLAVESVEELSGLAGRNMAGMDLHRPFIDSVAFPCPHCDGLMHRHPHVIDAGLDAAVLTLLQAHEDADQAYSADLVCESVERSKAWFYALNSLGNLFFDGSPYRYLINLPVLIRDGEGISAHSPRQLSDPWDIVHDHGADALRWAFLCYPSVGDQVEFSNELLLAAKNNFICPLWDNYATLVNYASRVGWSPNTVGAPGLSNKAILDLWLFSRLNLLVNEVTQSLEEYDNSAACKLLQVFLAELSGWYVPLSKRRFKDDVSSEDREAAFSSLYQALVTFVKLLAPFLPFIAEEIYQKLVRSLDPLANSSIHLYEWPVANNATIDADLNQKMLFLKELSLQSQLIRESAGIKAKQPLAGAVITFQSLDDADAFHPFTDMLPDALNVRKVSYKVDEALSTPDDVQVSLDLRLTVGLVQEGLADEFIRQVQEFSLKAGFTQDTSISLFVNATPHLKGAIQALDKRIMKETNSIEIHLVDQQLSTGTEPGKGSCRLYTMAEFDGERVTFGIEKA